MRILHTSDWHLGRSLHKVDLLEAQTRALDFIVDFTKRSKVDAVIVAGDVFDRAVPPVEAIRLFTQTIERLSHLATVIVTSGNHDSAIRLGYGAALFRPGIHLVTTTAEVGRGIDITSGDVLVRIYPIPFLVPDDARVAFALDDEPLPRSHDAVLSAAMDRIRTDIANQQPEPTATIAVAHAFVTGGAASDSERDISVGGVDSVGVSCFTGVDYVALGHLHGAQTISGDGVTARYSGSLLRYSFSEAQHDKSVTIIDVAEDGELSIWEEPIPQPRDMAIISGTLDQLTSDELVAQHRESWLQITVVDDARPPDLVSRLRALYPHALSILHRPANAAGRNGVTTETLASLQPNLVTEQFIAEVTCRPVTDAESELVISVYDKVAHRQVSQ